MPEIVTSENLAEFHAQHIRQAEPPPEPDPEPTAEEVPSADAEQKPTEDEKKPNKLERRFSDLTKQREAARREAEAERAKREELEAKLAAYERPARQEAPQEDVKPRPDDYSDAFEYAEKLAEWSARQAIAARDKADQDRRAQEQQQTVLKGWNERLNAARQEMPDFDDMVSSSEAVVSDQIRDAILESDLGPQVLYHLAENPEIAQKWAGMPTAAALRALGRLEASLEKREQPEAPSRPKAAPPINPVRAMAAGTTTSVDSDGEFRGSYAAYRAARLAGKIK